MSKDDINKTVNTRHRGKRGPVFATHQELAAIWRKLDNITSAEEKYLEVTPGPNGIIFNVIAENIGQSTNTSNTYVVKITSGGPGTSYIGNVYFNGPEDGPTHTGVPIKCLQIASTETVPAGTWAIAARIRASGIGTSSSESSSSTENSGTETSSQSAITESLSSSSASSSSSGEDVFQYYVQMPLFL